MKAITGRSDARRYPIAIGSAQPIVQSAVDCIIRRGAGAFPDITADGFLPICTLEHVIPAPLELAVPAP